MRNYFSTRGIQYNYVANGNSGVLYAMGANDVDLLAEINLTNAAVIANFDPLPVTFTYPNGAVTVYWLLDKVNFMSLVNFTTGIDALRVDAILRDQFHPKPIWPSLLAPAETPRKTGWKDEAGVSRKPQGSEGGTPIPTQGFNFPVDFLSSLVLIYQRLLEVGQSGLASQLAVFIAKIVRKQSIDTKALQALLDRAAPFVS